MTMSQESPENRFPGIDPGQAGCDDDTPIDRAAPSSPSASSSSSAWPFRFPRPAPLARGMPAKRDSVSRLAPDRNVPPGYLGQLARMEALLASTGQHDPPSSPTSDPPPLSTPSWSGMLATLDMADPTAPNSLSASPSSSSPHPPSRSYRRRLFTDPPATSFRSLSQPTIPFPSTDRPSSAHPLYYLASTPEKILDAPGTSDDFYAHRLSWSSLNLVGVGLGSDTYLWHPDSGESTQLPPASNSNATSRVTALAFTPSGAHLTVGIDAGVVAHFDVATHTRIRSGKPTFPPSEHQDVTCVKLTNLGVAATRTTCMAYVSSTALLTGDVTGRILLWDMRAPLATVPSTLRRVHAPGNPVCGLAANGDGVTFASGGNDGAVCVWDVRRIDKPVVTWQEAHAGAVRALAWCPERANVLATGGGTADARIKYRDTLTRRSIARVDTGGQVTALRFLAHAYSPPPSPSPSLEETLATRDPVLLSAAGYRSSALADAGGSPPPRLTAWQGARRVWSQDDAHADHRVLDLSVSPDEEFMATLGADESLHVWRMRPVADKGDRPDKDVQPAGIKRIKSFSSAAMRKASGVGVAARLAEVVAEQAGVSTRELLAKKVVSYSPYRRPVTR